MQRPRPGCHREVAIAHGAALAQNGSHFHDRIGMVACHSAKSRTAFGLAAHDRAPVGKLVHWPEGQPASPVEELAPPVGQLFPQTGCIVEHTTVQCDIVAASDDLQRVELQILHRAHGLLGARAAAPAPPRPQALLAQNEAAGCLDVDGQHE